MLRRLLYRFSRKGPYGLEKGKVKIPLKIEINTETAPTETTDETKQDFQKQYSWFLRKQMLLVFQGLVIPAGMVARAYFTDDVLSLEYAKRVEQSVIVSSLSVYISGIHRFLGGGPSPTGTKIIQGWFIGSFVGLLAATLLGVPPIYRTGALLLINSIFTTIERGLSPLQIIPEEEQNVMDDYTQKLILGLRILLNIILMYQTYLCYASTSERRKVEELISDINRTNHQLAAAKQ